MEMEIIKLEKLFQGEPMAGDLQTGDIVLIERPSGEIQIARTASLDWNGNTKMFYTFGCENAVTTTLLDVRVTLVHPDDGSIIHRLGHICLHDGNVTDDQRINLIGSKHFKTAVQDICKILENLDTCASMPLSFTPGYISPKGYDLLHTIEDDNILHSRSTIVITGHARGKDDYIGEDTMREIESAKKNNRSVYKITVNGYFE